MWTRLKSSLTLRIFLITNALLMAACVVTYGAIAYLTPISYTALLEEELNRETDALLMRLSETNAGESAGILEEFARRTGADIRLTDEYGRNLYDTVPDATEMLAYGEEAVALEGTCSVNELPDESVMESVYTIEAMENSAGTAIVQDGIEQETVIEGYAHLASSREFRFRDGTGAVLAVQGGRKAVNQAAEAMKQTLPFLLLAIAGISLLGSFFYARFITAPIISLSRIAGRIAVFDFNARWQNTRADEIGTLGDSLNRLSDNLSGTLSKLEKVNEKLQRDIERERELDRQRLAFFSAASHELKTPVTILKGQLSGMLAQVGAYRDREKYLARALEVTGRMEGLIKEILTISRIESGSFSLDAAEIDLGEMMKEQLALDEELIEHKRMLLDAQIAPNVTVHGNKSLLANALDNVLMNAILYSPSGASIRVRIWDCAFSVENTGASIPQEALERLFTPFYRVEQSRNRKDGGSGLGLYLVKSILKLHGASCGMENTERGVCFTARFKQKEGEAGTEKTEGLIPRPERHLKEYPASAEGDSGSCA